jgi:NUMOD4 motif/HNH endonuclease
MYEYMLEHFEKWLPVVGYEGLYEVSNCGRVRSLARNVRSKNPNKFYLKPGRILVLVPSRYVYLDVCLSDKDGRSKSHRVASIVTAAFIGPRPGGLQIDHKDGDKQNNCVWNLRYVTPKANKGAGNYTQRHPSGEDNGFSKLTKQDAVEIRRLALEGMSQKEIGKIFNIHQTHVGKIINHALWRIE